MSFFTPEQQEPNQISSCLSKPVCNQSLLTRDWSTGLQAEPSSLQSTKTNSLSQLMGDVTRPHVPLLKSDTHRIKHLPVYVCVIGRQPRKLLIVK